MRDNWCIGFSRRYTVGVWVGNFNGEPMWDVSGVTGAAPAWQEILNHLHRSTPSLPPPVPSGLVAQRIRYQPAVEPARREWFIGGTQQIVWQQAGAGGNAILYPGNGEIIALDPDIPPQRQQIWFSAERDGEWWLNGKKLGSGSQWRWQPVAGRYLLRWREKRGGGSDQLRFEVRGSLWQ